jgi:hypothetical protein
MSIEWHWAAERRRKVIERYFCELRKAASSVLSLLPGICTVLYVALIIAGATGFLLH